VSLVEQYTIDSEYLAYFLPKKNQNKPNFFLYKRDIMQLFSADATIFLAKFKKKICPRKLK
jgi:hypothetical protein